MCFALSSRNQLKIREMEKDKFREKIEAVRMRLSNRIDLLAKHEQEYKDDGKGYEAERCDLRARQLYMVLNDIDKALKQEL